MNLYRKFLYNVGKLSGRIILKTTDFDYDYFIFFSSYTIGGADKVHVQLVNCLSDFKKIVFFTEKSEYNKFKKNYQAKNYDIYFFYRYRIIFKPFLSGFFSTIINARSDTIVFGGNSRFFYDLIPYLRPEIKIADIIHAFGGGFDSYSLPYVRRLSKRMVISKKTQIDIMTQYKTHGIHNSFLDRIHVIENKLSPKEIVPLDISRKKELIALFVGRPSVEKRVDLLELIARNCRKNNLPIKFNIIGFNKYSKSENIEYFGPVLSDEKIAENYNAASVVLLVSTYEGFPLVVMEAMARGVIPICTDVGGLSQHIVNYENGILIDPALSEKEMVGQIVNILNELSLNPVKLHELRKNAHEYARKNFIGINYCKTINEFFNEIKYGQNLSANGKL